MKVLKILYQECKKLDLIPRPVQIEAIKWFESIWDSDNNCKILSSAVGSGKSLIAKTIAEYNKKFNKITAIITPQNLLIDQYIEEFKDINFLKGKKNYLCNDLHTTCDEGGEIQKLIKKSCSNCPYKQSKNRAIIEKMTIFNPMSYYSLPKYDQEGIIYDVDTIIIDEFQTLPSMLRELSTIKIWWHDIKWEKGISSSIPKIVELLESYNSRLTALICNKNTELKDRVKYFNMQKKIDFILYQLTKSSEFFICEEMKEKYRSIPTDALLIRPKYVPPSIFKNFFKIAKRVILMSGTAFPNIWKELGFEKIDYLDLPSPIPKERRQIFITNAVNISHKLETSARFDMLQELILQIRYIVDILHPYQNGVILLPYNLASELKCALSEKHYIHMDKSTKKSVISDFKNGIIYGVGIFSGSYEGISLNDHISRFTIIPKITYPYLLDTVVKTRMQENPLNYALETITTIVQATGRSTRSEKDFSFTYILDKNFRSLYPQVSSFLPNYFKESLNFKLPDLEQIQLFNEFLKEYDENRKAP